MERGGDGSEGGERKGQGRERGVMERGDTEAGVRMEETVPD